MNKWKKRKEKIRRFLTEPTFSSDNTLFFSNYSLALICIAQLKAEIFESHFQIIDAT